MSLSGGHGNDAEKKNEDVLPITPIEEPDEKAAGDGDNKDRTPQQSIDLDKTNRSGRTRWTPGASVASIWKDSWRALSTPTIPGGLALSVVVILVIIFGYRALMMPSPDSVPVISVNFTGGILAADDARLSNLENHLDNCNVQLKQKKDATSIAFFQEASAAGRDDMSDAMNRYLYFAIMHAVVLRRPFDGTAVGQKVGRVDVETYLNSMLDTMNDEEITSKDAQAEFKEMNRYLYLTIVQADVLQSEYSAHPLPDADKPTPIVDPVILPVHPADEEEPEINDLKNKLETEKGQVHALEVKLQTEESLTAKLKIQIQNLMTELKDERTRNGELTRDLGTCKENADACSKNLKDCQDKVPDKPSSRSHSPGDDEYDYWTRE